MNRCIPFSIICFLYQSGMTSDGCSWGYVSFAHFCYFFYCRASLVHILILFGLKNINLLFQIFIGKQYKYIDSKWQEVDYADSLKITKIEGQVRH